jgi:subtilisin family serine protease
MFRGFEGAAGNNGIGVGGINWSVQLMSCKSLDATGSGQTSDAISSLDECSADEKQWLQHRGHEQRLGGPVYSLCGNLKA